jgi:hypothetical protein
MWARPTDHTLPTPPAAITAHLAQRLEPVRRAALPAAPPPGAPLPPESAPGAEAWGSLAAPVSAASRARGPMRMPVRMHMCHMCPHACGPLCCAALSCPAAGRAPISLSLCPLCAHGHLGHPAPAPALQQIPPPLALAPERPAAVQVAVLGMHLRGLQPGAPQPAPGPACWLPGVDHSVPVPLARWDADGTAGVQDWPGRRWGRCCQWVLPCMSWMQ